MPTPFYAPRLKGVNRSVNLQGIDKPGFIEAIKESERPRSRRDLIQASIGKRQAVYSNGRIGLLARHSSV
jgi:hypothetical protein